MASIEPTTNGYILKWRLGGKRTGAPQSLTFKVPPGHRPTATRKLAEAAKQLVESRTHALTREQVRAAILGDEPTTTVSTAPTFAAWMGTYLEERRRSGDAQPDTIARYEQVLRARALPYLGHLRLDEITVDTIRDWVRWMVAAGRRPDGKPMAAGTLRRAHAILHGCLGAAAPRIIPANPVARPVGARKHIAGLPKSTTAEGMFLEPWEVDAIRANASPVLQDMMDVAVRTGLRLGELVVLRVRDLALAGGRPHIKVVRALKDDGSIGAPKSAKSRRDVNISGQVLGVLQRRCAGKAADDLVFPAPRGGVWDENNLRRRHWLPAVAAAQRCAEHPPPEPAKQATGPRRKLRPDEVSTCTCPGRVRRTPRFHDLRHSAASLMIEAGMTAKQVQIRMGHASFQITMDVYGHLWERSGVDRLDEVDRLLSGAPVPAATRRADVATRRSRRALAPRAGRPPVSG